MTNDMEVCLALLLGIMIPVLYATLAKSEGDRRESVLAGKPYPESFSNPSWARAAIAGIVFCILAILVFGVYDVFELRR